METKAKIAWLVIDKDYPDIAEVYSKEPGEHIVLCPYSYIVTKIVYFEVE